MKDVIYSNSFGIFVVLDFGPRRDLLCKCSNQIIFSEPCQLPRAEITAEISGPVENEEMHNKCTEKSILSILLIYVPNQL